MMKGFVSISALALVLAPSMALAQQPADPAPAPAPAPAQQPAPVSPVAPPPDASQPGAGAAITTPKTADKATGISPADEAPAPLIWRGTTFTYTNAASTTMLGLGIDQIGPEEDYYGMDWVVAPQLYVLDLPDDKIVLFGEAGITLEITDSGTTTTKREPQFRDTQLGAGYLRNIWTSEDKEWNTSGAFRARAVLPSSPNSQAQGRYLTSSLSLSLTQQIRLLGREADGLNNLTVIGSFTWSHLFSRAKQPTNPDLERDRQSASGANISSDILTSSSFDRDRLIPGVTFVLPLYKDLSLTTAFRLIGRFKDRFQSEGCVVDQPGTGCVEDPADPNAPTYFTNSTFDISLTQPIYDVVALNIGYNNETLTLGEDGKNRNIFYSPSAQFYLDIVANIDIIYDKASGRSQMELPPGPRGVITASNESGMPSF